MALEDLTGTGKFVTALVPANPLAADDRREGDDHIRGIKNVLRNTFPALDGAVTHNAAAINAGVAGGAGAVQKTGDTMTGPLDLRNAAPSLYLYNTAAPVNQRFWQMLTGTDGAFIMYRTNDAGVTLNTPWFGWSGAAGWAINGAPITTGAPSDERWKTCIENSIVKAVPMLQRIRLISFRWLAGSGWGDSTERHDCGFSAQQLMEVNPEFVQVTPTSDAQEGRLFVRHDAMVPWLVKAMQELAARVIVLEQDARGRGAMP